MTRKQVSVVSCVIQAALVGILLLPGRGEDALGVLDTVRRYSAVGFRSDAQVYFAAAVCLPVLTILGHFLLRPRRNFGLGACLSALYALATACFSESARVKLAGMAQVTGQYYLMVFLAVLCVALEIYGFLMAA
ncbi:MAG TPA: hypothetical protein DEP64_06275 [Ruminococcaceae bacterium]|nr:hypothetical protein [Oscillospiraceae bacterium]